jgi:hypothetical protein
MFCRITPIETGIVAAKKRLVSLLWERAYPAVA